MSLTPAQLEMRKSGIGASETPMVFGESPHGGPVALFMRKLGLETYETTDAQEFGNEIEPIVASWYARKTGAELTHATTYRHSALPWILATPDRHVNGRQKLLQIKLVGQWMAHHWKDTDDGLPDYVRIQVTQEMDVTGVHLCDVAALICGTEPRIYQVEYDAEFAESIREGVTAFWKNHIEPKIDPPADGSEEFERLMKIRYPFSNRPPLEVAPRELDQLGMALLNVRERGAEVKREADLIEQRMKEILGARSGAKGPGWRLTWNANAKGVRSFLFKPDTSIQHGKAA